MESAALTIICILVIVFSWVAGADHQESQIKKSCDSVQVIVLKGTGYTCYSNPHIAELGEDRTNERHRDRP